MKERPIIFSGPMVRAILDGRKTQTRRVMKPQPEVDDDPKWAGGSGLRWPWATYCVGYFDAWPHGCPLPREMATQCPYGVPGNVLWIKETFAARIDVDPDEDPAKALQYLLHRADYDGDIADEWHNYGGRWRSPRFMPRWASRITLEVTDVRVQRVQDITEEDILAEGVTCDVAAKMSGIPWSSLPTLHHAYAAAWDHLNFKRAPWSSNPWVWAVTFRRVTP